MKHHKTICIQHIMLSYNKNPNLSSTSCACIGERLPQSLSQLFLLALHLIGGAPRGNFGLDKNCVIPSHLRPFLGGGWWLNQSIWKIWSSNWIIFPGWDENKKYLKPPPRFVSTRHETQDDNAFNILLNYKGWTVDNIDLPHQANDVWIKFETTSPISVCLASHWCMENMLKEVALAFAAAASDISISGLAFDTWSTFNVGHPKGIAQYWPVRDGPLSKFAPKGNR